MRVLFGHNKDQGGHFLVGHGLSSSGAADPFAAYTLAGISPSYVMDTESGVYYDGTYYDGPNQLHDHATTSRRTVVDSDGLIKWAPHNDYSASTDMTDAFWSNVNAPISAGDDDAGFAITPTITNAAHLFYPGDVLTTVSGGQFTIELDAKANGYDWLQINTIAGGPSLDLANIDIANGVTGTVQANVSVLVSDVRDGWYNVKYTFTATGTTQTTFFYVANGDGVVSFAGDGSSGIKIRRMRFYRSDLGGMQSTGDATDPTYVPTAGSAVYWMGTDHDPATNEVLGVQGEPAATNLLLNSGTLSTQNVTTTNVAHTLHFTGTGTITLSGTSTAGPLVGTGTGESNRVSLTFTPTAGTLTLTVSGTVTNAQLETGSLPTSYIPTAGATATRAAPSVSKPLSEISASLDEIVAVMEFECSDVAADAVLAALDNAGTDLIHFRAHTSQANLFVQDGGATQADVDAGAISANTQYRAAFKMAADDFLASLGGATAVADTSGTMPTPTTLRLFNSSGAAPLAGIRVKKLIVYAGAAGSLDAIDATAIEGASA